MCLFIYLLSIYPSTYLSIYLPIHPSTYLLVYLSLYLELKDKLQGKCCTAVATFHGASRRDMASVNGVRPTRHAYKPGDNGVSINVWNGRRLSPPLPQDVPSARTVQIAGRATPSEKWRNPRRRKMTCFVLEDSNHMIPTFVSVNKQPQQCNTLVCP